MPRFSLRCVKRKKRFLGLFSLFSFLLLFTGLPAHAEPLIVDTILQNFAEIAFSIAATLTKAIVLMIDALVPIMTYNKFVNNPVVSNGWAVVRDTVNMFFVIILIIIAFGTIIGHERFKWQQQVPRLLIMAIVINFSKTLCGILIDFGQVIMITFANALREIAAGNFIQLLGLDKIYSISQASSIVTAIQQEGGATGTSLDFFAAGVMSVILTLWVLGTLIILVAILLFRIVMLWVLVVLAPLAWFMKGAEGVIDSNAYKEWWTEFKCMVAVGPVLAFFLWLTLAVAGAGNVAANSGFDVSASSNNADFTSSLLELNNFLSFLIGMAMLYAGFKAAAEFCSGMSGAFVGKALSAAKAVPGLVGGLALKTTARGAQMGVRGLAAAPGVAAAGARYLPYSAPVARGISALREGVKTGAWGAVEGIGRRTRIAPLERLGVKRKGMARDTEGMARVEEIKKQKKGLEDLGHDTIASLGDKYAKRGAPIGRAAEAEAMAILDQAMGDSRLQKQMRASGALQGLWNKFGARFEKDFAHDTAKTGAIVDFKKANADFTGSADLIKNVDDVGNLQAGAMGDAQVQGAMEGVQTTFKGKKADGSEYYLNALEAARAGHFGKDKQAAVVQATDVARLEGGQALENQLVSALRSGDRQSAENVVNETSRRYTGAGDQDRHQMAVSMDRMRASIERRKGDPMAQDILDQFDATRERVETTAGFGIPPEPAVGVSPDTYVRRNFDSASAPRLQAAANHFGSQETEKRGEAEALDRELQGLMGAERATNEAIAAKRKQIETVRSRIERSTQPEVDAAYDQLRAAQQLLAEARNSGYESEVKSGEAYVSETQAVYDQKAQGAQTEVSSNKEIQTLEREVAELVTQSTNPAQAEEAKKKSQQLDALKAQVERLRQTRERLEQEKSKRT